MHIRYFFEDACAPRRASWRLPAISRSSSSGFAPRVADKLHGGFDFDTVNKSFFVAVGTPTRWSISSDSGAIKGDQSLHQRLHVRNMPNSKVVKNLNLIAQDVIPRVRVGAPYERRVAAFSSKRSRPMPAQPFPAQFKRETHNINGVKTVVLTAGKGDPLVFLHGAGIWHGINFALPWTEKFRVIVPFHPGFGESGDDPAMNDMHDYVMHYLDLFDALEIAKMRLVGFSFGGWLAAKFAVAHGNRVERLVLVGPAGLRGKERPRATCSVCRWNKLLRCWFRISTSSSRTCRTIRKTSISWASVTAKAEHWRSGSTLTTPNCRATCIASPCRHSGLGRRRQALVGGSRRVCLGSSPRRDIQIFKGAGHLVLERRRAVDAVPQFLS